MAGPYDLEEQERIDAIKDWWEVNGKYVYAALAAFVLSLAGWRGWQYWTQSQAEDAAKMYVEVAKSRADPKKFVAAVDQIVAKHPGSFYASQAQLLAARDAFDRSDLATARTRLEWVVDKGAPSHRGVASVRLGAVLLDDKKYAEALKALDANTDESFAPMVADMKGDVYYAQGRIDEARAQYKAAVEKAGPRAPLKSVSQVKLEALGGGK
jgi:predicted negative regulator of RcsB-dependent stress response